MAKYAFTLKAIEDLSEIWDYTSTHWSENQADRYYYMLIDSCREIAKNPRLGRNYQGIMKKLFGYKSGRHIIFYRLISATEVEITRILHERMDLKNTKFRK